MPETTEDARPIGPAKEVPFHYVLTLQVATGPQVQTRTEDGVAFIRPGFSRTAVYKQCVDQLLGKFPEPPEAVAVLFFELSPERLVA